MSDTVGYGRPPKATRFQPGRSGNPSGRPKKRHSFAAELQEELARVVPGTEDPEPITNQQALARKLVALALAGNLRAAAIVVTCLGRSGESEAPLNEVAEDQEILDEFLRGRSMPPKE